MPAGKNLETLSVQHGQLNWTATKIGGQHMGAVDTSSVQVTINGNELITGELDIDMSTVKCIDLEGPRKEKLEKHLKSEDFFDVASIQLQDL